jgi:hypothetical protein
MYGMKEYLKDIERIKDVEIGSGVKIKYWHETYHDIIQAIVVKRKGKWLTVMGGNRRKKRVRVNRVISCLYKGRELVL